MRKLMFLFATLAAVLALVLPAASSGPAQAAPIQYNWGLWQDSNHLDYSLQGHAPTWEIQYYGQGERPQLAQMNGLPAGTVPFLEMQTNAGQCLAPGQNITGKTCTTANSVSTGGQDTWLNGFASDLHSYGEPVLVTFDHEMNGFWYPWGNGGSDNASAADWIAAWRHVESVIHGAAPNAAFMFTPNCKQGLPGFDQDWPGQSYVQAVGLDCYLRQSGQTWANTFAASGANSVSDIKSLGNGSNDFYVAETGVNNADTGYLSQIDSLVNGEVNAGGSGVMYFDKCGVPSGACTSEWHLTSAGASRFLSDLGVTAAARAATARPFLRATAQVLIEYRWDRTWQVAGSGLGNTARITKAAGQSYLVFANGNEWWFVEAGFTPARCLYHSGTFVYTGECANWAKGKLFRADDLGDGWNFVAPGTAAAMSFQQPAHAGEDMRMTTLGRDGYGQRWYLDVLNHRQRHAHTTAYHAAAAHSATGSVTGTARRGRLAGRTCTSNWSWKISHNYINHADWSEVWWTSNPCGFVIEDRSICNGTHGNYNTYSGRVVGVNIKDRASCNSWTDSLVHGAKKYETATGWTDYKTYWTW